MHAVILAGGNLGEENSFNSNKALFNFNGVPMIKHIISALKQSNEVDKIIAIGNKEILQEVIGEEVDLLVEDKKTIIDNLLEISRLFSKEKQILITTCDIPLLKGEMITHFIKAGLNQKKELIYPIVEKTICINAFPDVKRTFVPLREGSFTGGNLVLLDPSSITKIEKVARLMVENRKNPLKMSRILGIKFLLLLLIKRLTLHNIEKYIEKRWRITAKAIINDYPEVGNDIDRMEDIAILEKYT